MSEEIVRLLKELAWTRSVMEQGKEWIEETKKKLEKLPEYGELITLQEEQATYKNRCEEMDTQLREIALAEFDGENKKPISGIEIKMMTEVEITDEKQAKVWASQNAPATVTLNMSKFRPAVKNLELPFVQIKEEPKVFVASDLSEYLPK